MKKKPTKKKPAKRKQRQAHAAGSYRLQVRLPEDWKNAIEAAAAAAGLSASEFVRDAIAKRLTRQQRAELSDVHRGRPKK